MLAWQLCGIVAIILWTGGLSLLLFGTLKFTGLFRVSPEVEATGELWHCVISIVSTREREGERVREWQRERMKERIYLYIYRKGEEAGSANQYRSLDMLL